MATSFTELFSILCRWTFDFSRLLGQMFPRHQTSGWRAAVNLSAAGNSIVTQPWEPNYSCLSEAKDMKPSDDHHCSNLPWCIWVRSLHKRSSEFRLGNNSSFYFNWLIWFYEAAFLVIIIFSLHVVDYIYTQCQLFSQTSSRQTENLSQLQIRTNTGRKTEKTLTMWTPNIEL